MTLQILAGAKQPGRLEKLNTSCDFITKTRLLEKSIYA